MTIATRASQSKGAATPLHRSRTVECRLTQGVVCSFLLTSNYLIATQSKLALRYNDMSILENFHICEAFRAMRHRSCVLCVAVLNRGLGGSLVVRSRNRSRNILKNLTTADALTMRYTVIQCVLATDLSLGPRYIAAFESRAKRTDFGHDVCCDVMVAGTRLEASPKVVCGCAQDEDKLLLLQQMLKCADVSHATRPVRLHIRWSHLITEEFYLQGDTELEMVCCHACMLRVLQWPVVTSL